MSKQTYSAATEPGQAISFPSCKIVKGFRGRVMRDGKEVSSNGLFNSQAAAMRWATAKAAEMRAYRQRHGEGPDDVARRKREVQRAESRKIDRRRSKGGRIYELMQALASDAELVREWLPAQALKRLDEAREIVTFVETDVQPEKAAA